MIITPRSRALGLIAIAAVAAGVVYGMMAAESNRDVAGAACAASADRLAAMQQAAIGELAAFQVAEQASAMPPLAFFDANGGETTLAAWSGKVALVNLWATWCIPCREEMPDFAALQADYGGEDFEIVAINLDRGDRSGPAAFLKEVGADNLALNTDERSDTFQILKGEGLAFGLPSTILVDEAGCRIGHLTGPAKWDSDDGRALIEAALAKPVG